MESLGSKLGITAKEDNDKDKDVPTRRSDRNLDKKDARIEDLAKERAADKDNYGKSSTISDERVYLFKMVKNVCVELGCTIDLVNQNLELISNMEQARRNLYLQNIKNQEEEERTKSSPSPIDIGDAVLEDLCSGDDHSDAELELDYYDNLEKIFSSNRKVKIGTSANSVGKHAISIWGRGERKKETMKEMFVGEHSISKFSYDHARSI